MCIITDDAILQQCMHGESCIQHQVYCKATRATPSGPEGLFLQVAIPPQTAALLRAAACYPSCYQAPLSVPYEYWLS